MKKFLLILIVLALVFVVLPLHTKLAIRYFTANIDDYRIFQNRTVEAGVPVPWKESGFLGETVIPEEDLTVMEDRKTVAFLVVKDTQIIHESYWPPHGQDELSGSFSMAKSVIGLLVGKAIEEGYIESLDQPVGDFLPSFREGNKSRITIRHLLTMSAGLNWKEMYFNPFSKTTEAYYGRDLESLMGRLKAVHEPGKKFRYSSCDTQIAGMVLEAATGMTVSEYFSEKVWKRIGAENNALWSLDHADGKEKAFCCLNATARDFARLGQLVLQKGQWKGEQVIPEDYILEATSPAAGLVDENGNPLQEYGYFFWIIDYEGMQIPYFRGILGQFIFVVPEHNAVIVRLGHHRSRAMENGVPTDIYNYLHAGLSILEGV